jgi:hypothetical protein
VWDTGTTKNAKATNGDKWIERSRLSPWDAITEEDLEFSKQMQMMVLMI